MPALLVMQEKLQANNPNMRSDSHLCLDISKEVCTPSYEVVLSRLTNPSFSVSICLMNRLLTGCNVQTVCLHMNESAGPQ